VRFRITIHGAVYRQAADLCGDADGSTARLNALIVRLLSDTDLLSRTLDDIASEAAELVDTGATPEVSLGDDKQ
tara:strand:+ start:155 stop:376 length:222 start_codon:yes stop_codon:yes gene_type:complete